MDNLNTPEYLNECRKRLIENLRHVANAPSVQMQRKLSRRGRRKNKKEGWGVKEAHEDLSSCLPMT
jgi:hypothetical protein